MRQLLIGAALALLFGVSASARPSQFTVEIDTSGAEAVLAMALADPAHVEAAADNALKNPAVLAMLTKMAKYDKSVTPQSFRATAITFANGGGPGPNDLYDLDDLKNDPAPFERMLARFKSEGPALSRRIADRLRDFSPDGLDVHARLFVVLGSSNQNGWVPDQSKPDFYINLEFHGEEMDSLINTSTHELFHVVQGMVQPDWTSVFDDKPDLPPEAREQHRAHAVLMNLLLEGTATYVGDPTIYVATGPQLRRQQAELKRFLGASEDIFSLFDSTLFRARHDPDAKLDPLLAVDFSGLLDQSGYYVGYRMARTIDKYSGRARLRALIARPPEEFVAEYIAIAQAHPDDPDITPLAPSSVATVEELQQLGPQRP